jgi:hypothetical protein
MTNLSYAEQHSYYLALCEVAALTASSRKDYAFQVRDIRAQLRKDSQYADLVKQKFKAPDVIQGPKPKSLDTMVANHGR